MSLIKVDGYSNLRKDPSTGAVINIDSSSYQTYMKARKQAMEQYNERKETQETVSALQNEINNMKNDIAEIKGILITLINKNS